MTTLLQMFLESSYGVSVFAALRTAQDEAIRLRQHTIDIRMLLLGLLAQDQVVKILSFIGVNPGNITSDLVREIGTGCSMNSYRPTMFMRAVELAFTRARTVAQEIDIQDIGAEHLLLASIEGESYAATVLRGHGISYCKLRQAILEFSRQVTEDAGPQHPTAYLDAGPTSAKKK